MKEKQLKEYLKSSGCVEAWTCTVKQIQAGCECACAFVFTHANICMNEFL